VLCDLTRVAPTQLKGILTMTTHEKLLYKWKEKLSKKIIKAKIKIQNLGYLIAEEEKHINTCKSLREMIEKGKV